MTAGFLLTDVIMKDKVGLLPVFEGELVAEPMIAELGDSVQWVTLAEWEAMQSE